MKLSATIILIEDIDKIYESLLPEEKKIKRSEIKLTKDTDKLTITINADDAVALRASVNSVLKLLTIYEKMKTI